MAQVKKNARRASTARRKKQRVRLRWDRIFLVIILPILLIVFAIACIRGCDGPADEPQPTKFDTPITETQPAAAEVVGDTVAAEVVGDTTAANAVGDTAAAEEVGIAQPAAPKPIPNIQDVAERDASEVIAHRPQTMQRQNALLNIHARHSALRRHGFNAAADVYINTINKILSEHGLY